MATPALQLSALGSKAPSAHCVPSAWQLLVKSLQLPACFWALMRAHQLRAPMSNSGDSSVKSHPPNSSPPPNWGGGGASAPDTWSALQRAGTSWISQRCSELGASDCASRSSDAERTRSSLVARVADCAWAVQSQRCLAGISKRLQERAHNQATHQRKSGADELRCKTSGNVQSSQSSARQSCLASHERTTRQSSSFPKQRLGDVEIRLQ